MYKSNTTDKTIAYYNSHTKEFTERTVEADMSFCQEKFLKLLPPGAVILDAGCGSGRDSRFFLNHGMQIQAIDASVEICRQASAYIGQPVKCMRFDELDCSQMFDGIWACASLLHVEKKALPGILQKFHRALKTKGVFYASFKYGDGEEERLERFFSDYRLEEIEQVFLQDGLFELVESFETEDVRPDYKNKPWVNIIVRKKEK